MFNIERAFDLPGSKYDYRTSAQVTNVRREMAESGLPISLIGASVDCLQQLWKYWGEFEDGKLEIPLSPDTFAFRGRSHWKAARSYESERSIADRMRQAAYTVFRILLTSRTPGKVRQLSSTDYNVALQGKSASWILFTEYERVELRKDRVILGRALRSRVFGNVRYAFSRVITVTPIRHRGPVYHFRTADQSASLVAAGLALGASNWQEVHGGTSPGSEIAELLLRSIKG